MYIELSLVHLVDNFVKTCIETANGSDSYAKRSLLHWSNPPDEAKEILSKDNDSDIRELLAGKYYLSDSVQKTLAIDADNGVRNALYANPTVKSEIKKIIELVKIIEK